MKKIMESEQDKVLQRDLEELVNSELPMAEFENTTVLVTGATGLIGSQVVRTLAAYNRMKEGNIRILIYVRSREKTEKVYGELLQRGDIIPYYGDINNPVVIEEKIDYIVHGASATSSQYFVSHPVETIMTAIDGTKNILELAREKEVKGMVYLSSLEVYGTPEKEEGLIGETDYGYIDPLSVRSSYSEGKRMVECMCVAYAQEYGIPVKVARLSQTFGAGVAYGDGRVFAEFARCAVEKRNIVLHTQGNTVRSYCYTKDAVSAILYILLKGNTREAYNVTNMQTVISIREMAELVCSMFPESGIQVEFDLPKDLEKFGYNPEMKIRLDSSKLEGLGWKATVGLEEMYRRMIESSFR